MSITEASLAAAKPAPIADGKLAKGIVLACGIMPGLLLAIDAYRGNLGVNDVNFAIRTTGLVGLVFMTLSLVITPLRRLTGWNALLSARRNLGVYGFLYIATHFTIFFLFDRDGSVSSTLEEIVERVYLWFGTASLVIMIPLAITSFDSMVTRIGPKRWKLLHRLAYVAVLCGVVHYYLLVKADTTQPLIFAIVFGGLMVYRLVRHYFDLLAELKTAKEKTALARKAAAGPKKKKFWSGELQVARIFDETPDVKTFRFVSTDGGPLPFDHIAGQYMNLALTIDGKRVNRSYTIASSPTRAAYCEISVKRDGLASKHLHATLREGDKLKISAPAGKFFFAGHESERIVLVAGGVGITPMMSVVRSLTDRCWKGDMYLMFSVRKRGDIIFERELEYLQKRFPNLYVLVTLTGDPEAPWDGARGHISRELIEKFIPNLKKGPIMMCGPEKMMIAARKLFVAMGIPDSEVFEEQFISPPSPTEAESAGAALVAATAVEVEEVSNGEVPNVMFKKAGKTAELPSDLTVLEVAEDCGVSIPFECRSGICGQCKTKLVSGRVTMENQDALTAGDKAKGLILACQARAVRDVVVDA